MMRRILLSLGATAILFASACNEAPLPESEPAPTKPPPEGTLVHEGECARVFRVEGHLCQGTAERLDARACLIRDYFGGQPDLPRIDLYVADGSAEPSDWCRQPGLAGCTSGTVAYGYEESMNHEIVHALVFAITGHHAHSIIDEGLAHALDGGTNHLLKEPDLAGLLANNSAASQRGESTDFVGWMLMTYGPEVVMAVAHEVPLGSKQSTLEAALTKHLGMSIEEIIEAYEAETAWMYPGLPPLPAPVQPQEWKDGIEVTLACSEANTEGLADEPYLWRTIDFAVDEPGVYLFSFDEARAVWVEEVCEEPHFEQGDAPCELVSTWEFGFIYLKMGLEPGRRYRARIEASYPGPVSYTFRPMLGAAP